MGGENNENCESFIIIEDDVASSHNLEDMRQRKALRIRCSNWRKNECDLLNPKGVFPTRGCVMTSDLKEAILDDILGHDHVNLSILYCLGNIST